MITTETTTNTTSNDTQVNEETAGGDDMIKEMFEAGVHYGQVRARRHPSAKPYIFGTKNKVEIFDLEKVSDKCRQAEEYLQQLGSSNKTVLWVGGKMEARAAIKKAAEAINMPYVNGRWIGGTLTNFGQIRSRVERLEGLEQQMEKGEFSRYTKKERLLIEREIEDLRERFDGLRSLNELPSAMVVVDLEQENNAVQEARQLNIPIISFSSSNCDMTKADHPIPGNDASPKAVNLVLSRLGRSYQKGVKAAKL